MSRGIVAEMDLLAWDTIAGLEETVRRIRQKMYEHDGIDPGALFAVFSPDNPYAVYHSRAVQMLQEARLARAAHGYVGMVIGPNGKASVPGIKARRKGGRR